MRRRSLLFVLFLMSLLMLIVVPSAIAATPALYHSPNDDGIQPGSVPVEPGTPTVTLFLYLDAGAIPTAIGSPCIDGEGDEICQWEFALGLAGSATVSGFTPDVAQSVVQKIGASQFAATGGDAVGGEIGPIRIGELVLNTPDGNWSVLVTDGSVVDASFALDDVPQDLIAAPEPAWAAQLVAGWLALLGWTRRRGRHTTQDRSSSCSSAAGLRSSSLVAVALLALALPTTALAQDVDADGVPDVSDNCVHIANPGQEDVGGLFGPPGDGIGDVCQCGDVTGDGSVDLLDAATYQRAMEDALPLALDEDTCSVIGGRLDCDPNDRQTLREAIVQTGPGIAPVCQGANAIPPAPSRIVAAGDSITQGFAADCTCNSGTFGFLCLLCPAGGDQTEHSWFDGGSSSVTSFYDFYGGGGSGITSSRVSVSGAQMNGGSDSLSNQVDNILALVPIPDLVVVELGGNDVCNRECVDPGNCGNPLYDDQTWTAAVEAGLEKLVGFNHGSSLPPGSTVYLLGVPRVQDLYQAGVDKASSDVDCVDFRDDFDVCEIATLNSPMNGEDLPTRLAGISERLSRYNEILRDLALAYTTNSNGKNPGGIEVVSDYVNENIASIGTTEFGPNEINGGDCFHPSVSGQGLLSGSAWFSNPR
jgi:lysophospholipase L1-like esterase